LISLYIIKDIIKMLKPGSLIKGVLYLRSGVPVKTIKIIMFAVTLWILKEGLLITGSLYGLELREINEVLIVLIGIILSYGLYLLVVSLKEAKVTLKE